jgi:dynein heavy chain
MQFSPFKKPFEEEIQQWSDMLSAMSDTIEEWKKVQGQWMYLQPIFDSPDIVKQLTLESKKFRSVDKIWRTTIAATVENPNSLVACTREGLLQKMQEANNSLETV